MFTLLFILLLSASFENTFDMAHSALTRPAQTTELDRDYMLRCCCLIVEEEAVVRDDAEGLRLRAGGLAPELHGVDVGEAHLFDDVHAWVMELPTTLGSG